jgi:YVTN family beta-propeller protein
MQSAKLCKFDDKISRKLLFLMILEIITILVLIVILLSNNAFVQQTLHDKRLSEVVKQTSRFQEGSQIDVGDSPSEIGVNVVEDTVYVVKYGPDILSVISGENNRKIKDTRVGDGPDAIAVNGYTETVYVANYDSDSASVIDGTTNEVVAGITFHVNPLIQVTFYVMR